ncbi:ATP-dependent DNA helicase PIF1-like protein [Tanacetum coccineum]
MNSGNNHAVRPSLSNILHTSVTIHSNTIIRRDGNVQSFCCLKLSNIRIPDIGTSSRLRKRATDLKGKVIADTLNLAISEPARRATGPGHKRLTKKGWKPAALASTGTEVSCHSLGALSYECRSCNATMWYEERNNKGNRDPNPTFSLCCQQGTKLWSITNYHRIGSLLPKEGTQPRSTQLWFFDTHNEIRNRLGAFLDNDNDQELDGTIVRSLIRMLDQNSAIAKAFRMARDWCHSHTFVNVELRLLSERTSSRQYSLLTVAEVATLITNDYGDGEPTRDIVVNKKDIGLKRILEVHPSYMALYSHMEKMGIMITFRGPRYIMQKYQDAMALYRAYGNPDLFITFTSNPKWPKINEILTYIPGQRAHDRLKVGTSVFKHKLTELLDDLTKNHVLGESRAVVYVIEFQKRGLSHAHILLWLEDYYKCKTTADINDMISAELPSLTDDPLGYKAITDYMLHGPCGKDAKSATCPDRATIVIPKNVQKGQGGTPEKVVMVDEIKNYLNYRYLAPCEAVWRIFSFDIHHSYPSTMKLNFHLPNQHSVTLRDTDYLPALLEREEHYVWHEQSKMWRPQKQRKCIGRIVYSTLAAGERYFLQMLLNVVRGPQEFEELLTLTTKQIQNYCLLEIQDLLNTNGRTLMEFKDLPQPNSALLTNMDNRLIREALDFDMNKSIILHQQLYPQGHQKDLLIQDYHFKAKIRLEDCAGCCFIRRQDCSQQIVTETYPNFIERQKDDAYLQERAILTPKNDDADAINAYMFKKLEGEPVTYHNTDEICKASTDTLDQQHLYPVKFLNTLNFPGIIAVIMEYLVNIRKRRALWNLNEDILKNNDSEDQYAVSIKEDTAYPCLHSPKTTKERRAIHRIQKNSIRRIQDIEPIPTEYLSLYSDVPTRQILDSRGVVPTKPAANAKKAIQEMAEYSQKWQNGTSRGRSIKTFDGLAAIQAQLNNLGSEIKKVE